MTEAVGAVFDNYVAVGTIVYLVLMSPRPFAAFERYGVIVDREITSLDVHICTHIDIYGIATWGFYGGCRSENVEIDELYAVALVKVGGPKRRVDEVYAFELYVVAVLNKNKSWTHFLEVGALTIVLTTNPKLLPIA